MKKIKKGDIVTRISYDNDVLFIVDVIIKKGDLAILKGLTIRITADAPLSDLIMATKTHIRETINSLDNRIANILKFKEDTQRNTIRFGKVLHLDGDRKYSEKSSKYYKSLGLNAIVKNVSESRQPIVIKGLLERYLPDVLVVTGHDRND